VTARETQLVIIRHGESDANVAGLLSGHDTCTGLSDRGAQQAALLRDHGERVVVVGHGGTVGASFVALGNLSIRQAVTLTRETINTSITEWRRGEHDWRLIRFNDAAHLL
jgi:broad specificity phosphatase PhoE